MRQQEVVTRKKLYKSGKSWEGRAKYKALSVIDHSNDQVCQRLLTHYQAFCHYQ